MVPQQIIASCRYAFLIASCLAAPSSIPISLLTPEAVASSRATLMYWLYHHHSVPPVIDQPAYDLLRALPVTAIYSVDLLPSLPLNTVNEISSSSSTVASQPDLPQRSIHDQTTCKYFSFLINMYITVKR
jgi:hypothetical protein